MESARAGDPYQLAFVRFFGWLQIAGAAAVGAVWAVLGRMAQIAPLAAFVVTGTATLVLLARGRERAAALVATCGAWAAILLNMGLFNGVEGPGLSLVIALLVISAWTCGPRAALLLTIATPPVVFAMAWAERAGLPWPRVAEGPPLQKALVLSIIALVAGVLGRNIALAMRQQGATIERSHSQLEQVLQASPTPAAVLAADEARFMDCNEAFLRLFGGTREALLGGNAQPVDVLQDPAALRRAQERLGADGRLNGFPMQGRNAAGEPRSVLVYAEPIEWQGRPAVLAQVVDVTALRDAEETLRQLNASLERQVLERTAELASAKEELEGLALLTSHDVRAPLRWIHAHVEALEAGLAAPAQGELLGRAGKIGRAARHRGHMMDDLLELQRVGQSRFEARALDLSALAREILGELQRADPARRIDLAVEPGLHADADPLLVRAILQNLLDNAWKFSAREPRARIEFGREDGAEAPVYYVRDNGAGMDMAYAEKLFRPFQRLHSASEFEGTGIGLASAERAVRRHGGRIWAEGAPGRGATFRFTLAPG